MSEFATAPRFEGCPETDKEFQRYVDADIYESAVKNWRERDAQRLARISELEDKLAEVRKYTDLDGIDQLRFPHLKRMISLANKAARIAVAE